MGVAGRLQVGHIPLYDLRKFCGRRGDLRQARLQGGAVSRLRRAPLRDKREGKREHRRQIPVLLCGPRDDESVHPRQRDHGGRRQLGGTERPRGGILQAV